MVKQSHLTSAQIFEKAGIEKVKRKNGVEFL